MTIEKKNFGQMKNGTAVELYTLRDGIMSVEIITYGAAIRSINVPASGAQGKTRDIALGFDDIAGYEENTCFHGAVIGRIGNRVANAQYTMNGKVYDLEKNDGPHHLHGGSIGFHRQVWAAEVVEHAGETTALQLNLLDREGTTPGYPGDMTATVLYTLKEGELGIEYIAKCTEDTPINLTNHCYFNLAGHASGSIASHQIQIFADKITPVDSTLIPTGELRDVTGTPFDLRKETPIGPGMESDDEQIKLGGGYDHNWVISDLPHHSLELAATLSCDGVKMEILTTKPGLQFYSGNMLAPEVGKGGVTYARRSGLCLETQYWPNSVNAPSFPAKILRKTETYNHKTVYRFRAPL